MLVSRMNTPMLVGDVCYVADDYYDLFLPDRLWLARPRRESHTDMRWLTYFFSSEIGSRELRSLATGTSGSMKNIPKDRVLKLEVDVPSVQEQHAIADVLSDTDNLIAALERLIAKKEAIKQGMMQQLLTGRARLPGFTGEWRTTRLSELGVFLKGRGVKRDDVRPTGVPCIRYGELYTDFKDYTATVRSFVNTEVADTALPIISGDLLFAGSGETRDEIGKCVAYIGQPAAVAGGDIVVLRGNSFNPIYLATLTNMPSVANQKACAGQGDAVVHISSHALGSLTVKLPPRAEQNAIVEVVQDCDQEIEALRTGLSKARALKAGMMQELLTGRTRLLAKVTS
ncbi:restriction endonuclease subunit S [Corynebacterium sp. P7003]|uniref:Restriction endonuclease subunit S n=1 Tax=Corynebacterium pygosceleis TaxID=2800406 RepID=A0ABT3WTX2_9CORY|nr:restriction endonuclease subunit S [Corynebacterium pygosceleis]MCX7444394.1 restriction endonuclease subunit S [Corynebacterium pygosceleis]